VIQAGPRYLVPRRDGRVLVGSTEEHVGFEKGNTAAAVGRLIGFAGRLVPALAEASFECCWSGLRPGTADRVPYLGAAPGYENLFVAAGHFRSGLQMSPGTARLLRQAILDQATDIPLAPFGFDRPAGAFATHGDRETPTRSVREV
jgi:glycine oxidase